MGGSGGRRCGRVRERGRGPEEGEGERGVQRRVWEVEGKREGKG